MKYRAVVQGVEVDGHPVQILTQSEEEVMARARILRDKYDADVKVFQTYERVLTTVRKTYKKVVSGA